MNDHSFRLEQASEQDFQRLFELRLLTMRESLERIGRFDERRAFERFRKSFRAECTRLIVLSDGSLGGCVALGPSDDGLLLEHFYISPALQSFGLGTAVLQTLLMEADELGLAVRLSVLQKSDAGRFYGRNGFTNTGADEWDVYFERSPQKKRHL